MKAHTPMTDALRVNASATFDSHEKTLHAMGKLEAINADLLSALEGAQKALRTALPFVPSDNEAHFVGEWLDEVNAAIARARGQ